MVKNVESFEVNLITFLKTFVDEQATALGTEIRYFSKKLFEDLILRVILSKNMGAKPQQSFQIISLI